MIKRKGKEKTFCDLPYDTVVVILEFCDNQTLWCDFPQTCKEFARILKTYLYILKRDCCNCKNNDDLVISKGLRKVWDPREKKSSFVCFDCLSKIFVVCGDCNKVISIRQIGLWNIYFCKTCRKELCDCCVKNHVH